MVLVEERVVAAGLQAGREVPAWVIGRADGTGGWEGCCCGFVSRH